MKFDIFAQRSPVRRSIFRSISSTNDAPEDSAEDLFTEETDVTERKEEQSTWSWQEYFDQYEAAYASCQQEEEDFRIALLRRERLRSSHFPQRKPVLDSTLIHSLPSL